MAKCSRCGQRKAKRHCPALDDVLCPQCCAEGRLSSIDCPLDCEHLAGERYQHLRRKERAATLGQGLLQSLAARFRNELSFEIAFQLSSDIYWWTLEKGSLTDAMIARGVLDAADRESPLYIESSTSTPLGRYLSHLIARVGK
ncbi:MAG TPA: hypothetical protein VK116_08965, partial [Planctomycetota bacterium]|nr:hypothetical protein [Planctomycetota bacterium]